MDFPKKGKKEKEVFKKLTEFKQLDFSFTKGKILGSMCTQPHPIAQKAYKQFIETNLGDPALFPGTREMEKQIISMLSDLMHSPNDKSTGMVVSGGTEGNISAMRIAHRLSGKETIILPENAHFSFQKVASMLGMKIVSIPLDEHFCMDTQQFKKQVKKHDDIAAVVGVAGSTELGTIDDIPLLSDVCEDEHLFLHVDTAFGGFVIPFMKNQSLPAFDFTLPGVCSIQVDAHKMGCSVIPMGVLLVRNKRMLNEIKVDSPCVSTAKQATILGTRPGGSVAATYAVLQYLGTKGYEKIVDNCLETTHYAAQRIQDIGLSLAREPVMNVLGIKTNDADALVTKLSHKGWRVGKMNRISCIRLVMMPHVTKRIIDEFIPDLQKACNQLGMI